VPFSPGGRTLATACFDNTVKLWNVATQQELATLRRSDHGRGAAFSPDGNTLAALSADGVLKRWRALTFAQTDAHDGARRRPSR
jgi:WD40 repeat protein